MNLLITFILLLIVLGVVYSLFFASSTTSEYEQSLIEYKNTLLELISGLENHIKDYESIIVSYQKLNEATRLYDDKIAELQDKVLFFQNLLKESKVDLAKIEKNGI